MKRITFELIDRRLVTLDMNCEEDWGEVEVVPSGRNGDERIFIGNETMERVEAVRFFMEDEKDEYTEEDSIKNRWKTYNEVFKGDVIREKLFGMCKYCCGYTLEDLKNDLKSYGFDVDRIYIPSELWY